MAQLMTKEDNRAVSINPATGEILGYSYLNSFEDVKAAVKEAREAQKEWSKIPVKKRANYFKPLKQYLADNADILAETISKDNGKTRIDALVTEIITGAMGVNYYCKNAHKFLKEKKLGTGNIFFINKRSKCVRVPYGVVGIISPWNYPFAIPFPEVVMALIAGNAVVIKCASETQKVGEMLRDAIDYLKLPDGLFHYINMPGRLAGDAFLESGIDKLFFTGSVAVGKKLMAKAAETLTPINLELGGNDAMIVCSDADLYRAANGAIWAGFSNAGQSCGGVERIYIEEDVYDEFIKILCEKVEKLRVGYDRDYNVDIGVITTENQLKKIKEHVDEALSMGAKIIAKSKIVEGKNVMPAMVIVDVNHNMQIMRDETFGPVVGVMKVSSIQEAVELANDSYLGLTGSVWSKNLKKAEKIGRQIKAGTITINDHLMSHGLPETSWGGFKQSGTGRTHGFLGFNELTQPQMIVNDILPFIKKNIFWHPYDKKLYDGLKGILQFLYFPNIRKKVIGVISLLRVFPRMFRK